MSQERAASPAFAERARALREAWAERRQLESLASRHDFASQYRLLLVLHDWCSAALAQVAELYGPELTVDLSRPPAPAGADTSFQVTLATSFSLVFSIGARSRDGDARWSISVHQRDPAPFDQHVPAGPPRGRWTRSRVEELLLALLAAFERARTESRRPATAGPGTPTAAAG